MTELQEEVVQPGSDFPVPAGNQRERWLILASCSLASSATLLHPPLWVFDPPGVQPFDAAWSDFRLIASISGVLQVAFMLLGGVLGDLHGRRRLWLIGLWGFVASNVLLMFSPLPGWHVTLRFSALAFGAFFAPLALATINYTFTDATRSKAFAIFVIINAGAVQIAWLQGQFLFGWFGWRAAYLLPILFGLLAIHWVYRYVSETRSDARRHLDILLQSGWTLLMLAVIYGIAVLPVAAERWAYVVGAALVVGIVGATLVFWWNVNSPKAMLRDRTFRARDLTALIVTGALLSFVLLGFGLRTLGYFQVVRSMSAIAAVISLAPVLVGLAIGLFIILRATRKYQARLVIASGIIVMAIAMAGVTSLPQDVSYLSFILPFIIFGIGYLVAATVWTGAFLRTAVARYLGVTAAITGATSVIGGAVGSAVTGNLLAQLGADLYLERLMAAGVNVVEAIEALVAFKTLVLSEPADIAAVSEHLHFELLANYREVYGIAYAQILWIMVALCLVTAVIIGVGLRSSLRATSVSQRGEEIKGA